MAEAPENNPIKPLPEEPTREMWAAMSAAFIAVHREYGREMTLNADTVTEAIYRAAFGALDDADSVVIRKSEYSRLTDIFAVLSYAADFIGSNSRRGVFIQAFAEGHQWAIDDFENHKKRG